MAYWVETNEKRAANIKRIYGYMHDERTCMVGVYEMAEGTFSVVWQGAGTLVPVIQTGLRSLEAAKKYAEKIPRTKLIQPRAVVFNG